MWDAIFRDWCQFSPQKYLREVTDKASKMLSYWMGYYIIENIWQLWNKFCRNGTRDLTMHCQGATRAGSAPEGAKLGTHSSTTASWAGPHQASPTHHPPWEEQGSPGGVWPGPAQTPHNRAGPWGQGQPEAGKPACPMAGGLGRIREATAKWWALLGWGVGPGLWPGCGAASLYYHQQDRVILRCAGFVLALGPGKTLWHLQTPLNYPTISPECVKHLQKKKSDILTSEILLLIFFLCRLLESPNTSFLSSCW